MKNSKKADRALFTSSFLFPFLADEEEELLLLLSPPKPLPLEAETRRSGQRRGALGRRRSIEIDGGDGIGAATVAVADEIRALVGQAAAIESVKHVVSFQSEVLNRCETMRARERKGTRQGIQLAIFEIK